MPTRRTSLSDEIVFKTGMMRPFTKQDAILQPVASWGDRVPHATIMPCPPVLVNVRSCRPERGLTVRERAGRTQGDRSHLRIPAYIRPEEPHDGKECVSTFRSRWTANK